MLTQSALSPEARPEALLIRSRKLGLAMSQLPALDRDGLFAFILFVPMLFMAEAGTYGAVVVVLATIVWAAMRRHSSPAR